jgi:hypothetical protein
MEDVADVEGHGDQFAQRHVGVDLEAPTCGSFASSKAAAILAFLSNRWPRQGLRAVARNAH